MSEIGGYRIYLGSSTDTLDMIAEITDPYQLAYQIDNLSTGTHYFSVTAFDTYGSESEMSMIGNATL